MEEKKIKKKKEKALRENNRENLAIACNDLGDYYNQHGQYREALQEYQEESRIYQRLGRKLEMAKANRMIAEMFMLLSEFSQALKHVNIYLKIVQGLNNKIEEQRAYATLGRAYLLQGQSQPDLPSAAGSLKNGEKAFIRSLLICKDLTGQISKLELLDMQARLYLNIGVVKEHMEDFEEAVKYLEKAMKIAKDHDLYELLHLCYVSASLLYHYKKNDTTLALRFCNLACDVAERLPNRTKKECETLITKSEIMIKMGDFQSAKQILHKAYKLNTPELNDRNTIIKTLKIVAALCYTLDSLVTVNSDDYQTRMKLYEKMGDGCCALQNYEKAIDYYLKMLECGEKCCETPKTLVPIYVSLYETYKDNKEYEKALEYLWKEYEINKDEPMEAFNSLCNIGEIYEIMLKPYWDTHDIYRRAMEEAKKSSKRRLEIIVFKRLANLQEKFHMTALKEELKDEAIKRGVDIDVEDYEDEDDGSVEDTLEQSTPDIGDDICLEDLTDSNDESEENSKPRSTRKRGTCLTIKRNNKGETQLHLACISGNLTLVQRLIEQGHTVNVRDHAGWLPLHEACNYGHHDIVELLLNKGALSAINDKGGISCDGITPLHDACINGYLNVVELLLDKGANPTIKANSGDTALNALDKWRNSVELDSCEQEQYEKIRSRLVHQLANAGMLTNTESNFPITNASSCRSVESLSMERLKQVIDNGSDSSYDESNCDRNYLNRSGRSNRSLTKYESDRESISSRKSVLKESNTSSSKNAKTEYKNAMESIKHPNRIHQQQEIHNAEQKKRKSGYLDSNDVDEDWLINDLKTQNKKKRRTGDSNGDHTRLSDKSYENDSDDDMSISIPNEGLGLIQQDDSTDAFNILLEASNNSKFSFSKPSSAKKAATRPTSSLSLSRKRSQTSLLQNGFQRVRSSNSFSNNDDSCESDSITPDLPDSTTSLATHSDLLRFEGVTSHSCTSTQIAQDLPSIVSFKIKVEDELLLVPVEKRKLPEINIKWLAEEASRRFYNRVGLRPILRLTTADGFAFEESDSITVATDENMLSSQVLEWKISPLSQRYEEICTQLNKSVNKELKNVLEKTQVSNFITLENFCLSFEEIEPLFKALVHQKMLTVLDLSNNFIQNEGCKQLAKCLPTLKHLRTLNLQGNCITFEGLNYFIEINDNMTTTSLNQQQQKKLILNDLEELNLNFNPLSNESVKILQSLLRNNFPKVVKLKLSSCNLTTFYDYDLNFNELIEFDCSFNRFQNLECFYKILKKLNSSKLTKLNLNSTLSEMNAGKLNKQELYEFFERGTSEKFQEIHLNNFNLTDSDIYRIILNFSNKTGKLSLKSLDFSFNSKLTLLSLTYIIENLSLSTNDFEKLTLLFLNCPHFLTIGNYNDFINNLKVILTNNKNNCSFTIGLTLPKEDEIELKTILEDFWISSNSENETSIDVKKWKRKAETFTNNIFLSTCSFYESN